MASQGYIEMRDQEIHSPEHQAPMHVMRGRPACWTDAATPRAPGFWDDGKSCGAAMTPAVWQVTLQHTAGCASCARARRALELAAGISGQYDAPFDWAEIARTVPWYERYFRLEA
jgi:hypothetical protein